MNETYVTIQGRLVADPTVRYSREGVPFSVFRVAHSARRPVRDQPGTFTDTPASFYDVSAFRSLGANVGTALHKGEPVTVFGRQRVNVFQRADGSSGSAVQIEAYAVGHDLSYGTTAFSKVVRAQYPDGDKLSHPEVREAFAMQDLGDPEHADYVVDDGSYGGTGEVPGQEHSAGEQADAGMNSGPLVREDSENAA